MLAIETARVGDAGREATIVLRSLPEQATRRLPARVRHPLSLLALAVVAVAVVGAVVWFLATSTHRGVAPPQGLASSHHELAVRPAQSAAVPYNPFGTTPEDPSTVGQAIDGDVSTYWQTESYVGGVLGKSGVGLYINAAPGVPANEAVVVTPTPGFHFQVWGTGYVPAVVYGSSPRPDITPARLGWTLLGSGVAAKTTTRIPLARVRVRRYYLLWITNLGPDPSGAPKSVQIAEFTLFHRSGG